MLFIFMCLTNDLNDIKDGISLRSFVSRLNILFYNIFLTTKVICPVTQGFRFFQDWWAEVTHGSKNGGPSSEIMGLSISN